MPSAAKHLAHIRAADRVTNDHAAACPKCGDLQTDPRRRYCDCGTSLYKQTNKRRTKP